MPVTMMSLDSLHITPLLQPRGKSLCKDTVTDYTVAAKSGAVFPPLLAFTVTDRKFPGPALVAGFHRHKAFKAAELTECEVELREGTFAEAWLAGFLSNSVNGLRYSREQKRHAVEQALLLFKKDSARQLAERLGVSNKFVSDIRKELVTAGKLEPVETVTSKDGAERPASNNKPSSEGTVTNTQFVQVDDQPSSPTSSSTSSPDDSSATTSPTSVGSSGDDAATGEQGSGEEEVDPADAFVQRVETLCRQIDRINAEVAELKKDRLSFSMHVDSAVAQIKAARSTLWQGRPNCDCPYCRINETDGCKACCMTKRVSKRIYDAGVEAVGGAS